MTSSPEPLRFGILGAAKIAPKALIAPAQSLSTVAITRVAARDNDRAIAFASSHDIAEVSASYRDLIEADDVDIVYNPLPMSLHAEWTIAALRAGKHVFCEKPFAANAIEAAQMVEVAEQTGLVLGEAFHYRYHPLMQRVIDLVHNGVIGDVAHVDANFAVSIAKPDLRWSYETAGGATMDLGCYPVHWVRDLCGEPTVTAATATADTDDPLIDADLTMELEFANGATGRVHSSMISDAADITLVVSGSHGSIEVTNPLAPQMGNLVTITTDAGTTSGPINAGDTYAHMLRAFVDHVHHGTPFPTKGDDSIANMAVIDAAYLAAGLPIRGNHE